MSKTKGQIKVELFCCESGEKLLEVLDSNFISKGLDYAYNYVMRNLFTRNKGVGANEIAINNPFYQMVLTDNDKPEKPLEDWVLEGNRVGYALTTGGYSGSDVSRGSYNTSESFTSAEQVHIVVDFPTSAGNGTFESIYFTPESSMYQPNNAYFLSEIKKEVTAIISLQKYNGMYYVLGFDRANYDKYIFVFDKSYKRTHFLTVNTNIYDFWIKDEEIYYLTTNSSNQVWKAPLANLGNPTSLSVANPSNETYAGIAFADDRWILSSSNSSSNSTSSSSSVFDNAWNVVDRANLGSYGFGYERFKLFAHKGLIIANNGAVYDPADGKFKGANFEYLRGFIDDDYIINTNGYIIPKYLISSRCLLDAPVTKTANTTMKITYDFMLPPLY